MVQWRTAVGVKVTHDIHLLLLAIFRRLEIVSTIERSTWQISFNRAHIVGNALLEVGVVLQIVHQKSWVTAIPLGCGAACGCMLAMLIHGKVS